MLASACSRLWTVPDGEQLTRVHEGPIETLDASCVRVVVWNVYKGKRPQWRTQLENRLQRSDLVLVQEMLFHPPTQDLVAGGELSWATATSFEYARRESLATGLGTAARADVVDAVALQSEGREPVTNTPKLALFTSHPLSDGTTLLVVNIHAINFAGFRSYHAQLDAVAARVADHEGPILVAGDFNTWSRRRRDHLEGLADDLDLTAVGFDLDPRRVALDHAFTRGMVVGQAEVHPGVASDHMALSFELARPEASGSDGACE